MIASAINESGYAVAILASVAVKSDYALALLD